MCRAVNGWSPVIITGRIPAVLHTRTASWTSGRGGSIIPTRPTRISSRRSSPSRPGRAPLAGAAPRCREPAGRRGPARHGRSDARAQGGVERLDAAFHPAPGGDREHAVDRTLRHGEVGRWRAPGRPALPDAGQTGRHLSGGTRHLVHSRHSLSHRVEGQLRDTRESALKVVLEDAEASRRHHQRSLGGIADRAIHFRLALVALQHGVVAEGSGDQQEVEVWLQPRVPGRGVGDRETEPGALGPLRELHPAGGHVEGGDRHAVLGQGPGLVRADHLDGSESLDGRQPADEGAPFQHALRA